MRDGFMRSGKTFVGPRLRQLRRDTGQTQSEMASKLGLSTSYVNLLENNQRSVSVQVLLRLTERYGVDWRDLVDDETPTLLADLRNAFQDPVFGETAPDLQELRAAIDHSPRMARAVLRLHKTYQALAERVLSIAEQGGDSALPTPQVLTASPEAVVHDLFRDKRNYFTTLEEAATGFRAGLEIDPDTAYAHFATRLRDIHGVRVERVPISARPTALRIYDAAEKRLFLSDALDHQNKVFQLTHILGLLECAEIIDEVLDQAEVKDPRGRARCHVELANYFAAAVLMPYHEFLEEAETRRYDIDLLAARFGVSFEQACHRLTTLQREGAQGVPFFFLRIDKAGNVTKRFNTTDFPLAEYGGACPRWDIHACFQAPGQILTQLVEMPDGTRFFTINRTVDRPAIDQEIRDYRLGVTLGCPLNSADRIGYAGMPAREKAAAATPIGINCRLCPRPNCAQRAHQPLYLELPLDVNKRGRTRFES